MIQHWYFMAMCPSVHIGNVMYLYFCHPGCDSVTHIENHLLIKNCTRYFSVTLNIMFLLNKITFFMFILNCVVFISPAPLLSFEKQDVKILLISMQ